MTVWPDEAVSGLWGKVENFPAQKLKPQNIRGDWLSACLTVESNTTFHSSEQSSHIPEIYKDRCWKGNPHPTKCEIESSDFS